MPELGYAGRTVLLFGAGGALGSGLATAFTQAGATVTGADKHLPRQDRQLEGVSYHAVDVLDDAALGALFDAVPVPWAVINTIGGFAPHSPLSELDPAELTGQLNLNLVSAALVTKHALRRMRPAGEGRIVHTASRAAQVTRGQGVRLLGQQAGRAPPGRDGRRRGQGHRRDGQLRRAQLHRHPGQPGRDTGRGLQHVAEGPRHRPGLRVPGLPRSPSGIGCCHPGVRRRAAQEHPYAWWRG